MKKPTPHTIGGQDLDAEKFDRLSRKSAARQASPGPERFLFMGEVEDPVLDVHIARGSIRVYDGTRPATKEEVRLLQSFPRAPPVAHPAAGHWVLNGTPGRWVRCGCNGCYMGPCPKPIEG